jgi:hypothetical protein
MLWADSIAREIALPLELPRTKKALATLTGAASHKVHRKSIIFR